MPGDYREEILLCRGGTDPGMTMLDPVDLCIRPLLSLSEGNSVYAAEVSSDGKSIVVGSKTGFIHLVLQGSQVSTQTIEGIRCCQGSPILSVCSVGRSETATSDTAANIIVWDLVQQKALRILESPCGPVCSLFCPDEGLLAGLTVHGRILVWDMASNNSPRVLPAPAPSAPYALVEAIHWKEADCWVWTDWRGRLVFFNPESLEIGCIEAHAGGACAVSAFENKLVSAGISDGFIKFWQPDSNKPWKTLEAPFGVTSLVCWLAGGCRCLTICKEGRACVYSVEDDKLVAQETLPGDNYRVAIGPEPESCRKRLARLRSERVERLCLEVKSSIRAGDFEALQSFYEELDSLGCQHMSLWLQALEAEKREDIIRQLQSCQKLVSLIRRKDLDLPECLFTYGQLLEKVWQLYKARSVYQRLADSGYMVEVVRKRLSHLSTLLSSLSKRECIIEAAVPLPVILEAAHILRSRPKTAHVLKRWPAVAFDGPIAPDDFLRKYESMRSGCHQELPPGRLSQVDWLTEDRRQSSAVVFFDVSGGIVSLAARFDLDFDCARLDPVAIVNAGQLYDEYAKRGFAELTARLESEVSPSPQLRILLAKIVLVTRQFVTRFRSLQEIY